MKKARQWGREDAKDAIILARESPTELDKNTFDLEVLGVEYASDRAGKPARRLVSGWDVIDEAMESGGEAWAAIPVLEERPVAARLPGGEKAWEAGGQEALEAFGDAFYAELEAADVLPIDTYHYPDHIQDLEGTPVISIYVVDRRRFTEFHQEHSLGTEFDGNWVLAEENVQKIYSEPKPSLRERLARVFKSG